MKRLREKGETVIKVSILYLKKAGTHFDENYYLNTHMPMTVKLLGPAIKALSVEIGISGAMPDQPPPYWAIVGFTCESIQAFTDAFQPHASVLQGDIPNYTDAEMQVQISQLRDIEPSR